MSSSRLIDLSHSVEDGIVTYPGLPAPLICDFLSREASRSHYAPGTEFQIGKIEMVSNTGTYLDVPFHRFADGRKHGAAEEKLAKEVLHRENAGNNPGRVTQTPLTIFP